MLVISLSFSPLADEPSVELSDVDVNFLSDPPTAPNITFKFTDPRNDKVLYKISCTLSYAGEEYSPTNYPLKSTANTETGELVFERVKEGLNKMKCANIHYQNNRGYKNILYTFTVLPSQKIEEAPIPEEDQVIIEDNSSEQPQPEEPPPYFEEAKVTVTEAEQAIETATNELRVVGLDNAEQKLEQAKTAFENGDYENAKRRPDQKPWAGLDLKDPREALKFTLLIQKYFYENMANQNPQNHNFNFIAQKNKNRYWCHMPWMHVGAAGREAIHGMTKERDLVPSTRIPIYNNATPGSNWGVAYFNGPGCETIGDVFGSASNPKHEPDFTQADFGDGTVIIKMLFTTADFPEIQGAYKWRASVSGAGSTDRSIQDVRHIQMDIAVKDSSLKGAIPALNNWVMAGFYYDPNYDFDKELKQVLGAENPLKGLPNIPKELFKMRPIGVQTGFESPEKGETIIFPGSFANGSGGRLNGPADNPKTSCLGCHGAAGTGASMIPGFLSMRMYEPYQQKPALDFNQQFALAKENYETNMK